jgi:tripartite-type tricarboxylate transporter receptor subunit TctC
VTTHKAKWTTIAALGLLTLVGIAPARAQEYPARPVRIITDSGPGSAVDATNRIITDSLSRVLGQQAIVINQPGAGGAVAVRAAAAAAPDGYTFVIASLSAFVAATETTPGLPIQVPKDFTAVAYLGGAPMFITASPSLGVKTISELIELAKKKPGELAYGTNGPGRLTHLTGELLQSNTGIKLLMVPYSGGTAQVLNDVMGGRIPIAIDAYSGLAGAIENKTVVPLAVAAPRRVPHFPNLPTVAETIPGFEAGGWQVLLAPAGTPDAIVQKVNGDVIKALADPEARSRLTRLGRDERPTSPAETLAFVHSEQRKWAPIVQRITAAR